MIKRKLILTVLFLLFATAGIMTLVFEKKILDDSSLLNIGNRSYIYEYYVSFLNHFLLCVLFSFGFFYTMGLSFCFTGQGVWLNGVHPRPRLFTFIKEYIAYLDLLVTISGALTATIVAPYIIIDKYSQSSPEVKTEDSNFRVFYNFPIRTKEENMYCCRSVPNPGLLKSQIISDVRQKNENRRYSENKFLIAISLAFIAQVLAGAAIAKSTLSLRVSQKIILYITS